MPFLRVYTNAKSVISHEEFVEKAAELVAKKLGKPLGYVVVVLGHPQAISFGGKCSSKGVLAYMDSIGFGNHKADLAQNLTDFFKQNLADVDDCNINISFTDMPASNVSIAGNLLG